MARKCSDCGSKDGHWIEGEDGDGDYFREWFCYDCYDEYYD